MCADLDEQGASFADRTLSDQECAYVFLGATYCKAGVGGARGGQEREGLPGGVPGDRGRHRRVRIDARCEVLGVAVGDSEGGAFWTQFLRSLKARGLAGTKLVSSDATRA